MNGIVFDIKRFTVHDGPGIRSTVFTKGCLLDCPWCQNPEGRSRGIDIWHFQSKCIMCHKCLSICPENALTIDNSNENHIVIDRSKCTNCGKCTEACSAKALVFDGRIMGSDEVVEELLKDRLFYEMSGGGITISGGDPLVQHEFNMDILNKCKALDIHTAIETCLYAQKKIVEKFTEAVDYFIVDLKLFDSDLHQSIVKAGNGIIRENFEMLAKKDVELLVRIPLIPGYTADEENIMLIARYVNSVKRSIPIELINFNPLGIDKYRLMNKPYKMDRELMLYPEQELDRFKEILRQEGIIIANC